MKAGVYEPKSKKEAPRGDNRGAQNTQHETTTKEGVNEAVGTFTVSGSARASVIYVNAERPGFPSDMLPSPLYEISKELSQYAGVPESVGFFAVASQISMALGKNLRVQSGSSRTTPGNIQVIIFMDSAGGKSEVLKVASRPLVERQLADRNKWIEEGSVSLAIEIQILKAQIKDLEKHLKDLMPDDRDKLFGLNKDLRKLELQMTEPQYFAEDYTIEALDDLLSRQNEQILCMTTEGIRPIQNMLGKYSKGGQTEDVVYVKGYSLEPTTINRITRKSPPLTEPTVAIMWMTQQDKIPMLFGNPVLVEGGFMPRIIPLRERADAKKSSWNGKLVRPEIEAIYRQLWTQLFEAYRLGGKCGPGENPETRIVQPTTEAVEMMEKHFNSLVDRRNSDLRSVALFPARWTENAWRLALILHAGRYGDKAHDHDLDSEICIAALKIMDWIGEDQLNMLAEGRKNVLQDRLDKLVHLIETKGNGGKIKVRDLKNSHGFESDEIDALVAAFPDVVGRTTEKTGGRDSDTVFLKP